MYYPNNEKNHSLPKIGTHKKCNDCSPHHSALPYCSLPTKIVKQACPTFPLQALLPQHHSIDRDFFHIFSSPDGITARHISQSVSQPVCKPVQSHSWDNRRTLSASRHYCLDDGHLRKCCCHLSSESRRLSHLSLPVAVCRHLVTDVCCSLRYGTESDEQKVCNSFGILFPINKLYPSYREGQANCDDSCGVLFMGNGLEWSLIRGCLLLRPLGTGSFFNFNTFEEAKKSRTIRPYGSLVGCGKSSYWMLVEKKVLRQKKNLFQVFKIFSRGQFKLYRIGCNAQDGKPISS